MKNKIKYTLIFTLLSSISMFGQTYLKVSINEKVKTLSSKAIRISENDTLKLKLNITKETKIKDIKFVLVVRKRCCDEQVVNEVQEQQQNEIQNNSENSKEDNKCEILIAEIDKIEDLEDLSSEVLQFTLNDVIETTENCKGTNIKLKMSYWLNQKEKRVEVYKFYLKL